MQGGNDAINWRTLIAACAAVCVFAFSLGEIFPLLSLNMESWGTSAHVIGLNSAMAPVGILLAGLVIPKLSHSFGPKAVAIFMAVLTGFIFLAYPTFPNLPSWFVLRLIQGISVATLFALSEAWILGSATGKSRGIVVGVYATCISATFGIGPAVVGWAGIHGYLPFVIGAAILFVAVLPVTLVRPKAAAVEQEHISMLGFLPKAPLLLTGICVHAMFDGGMLSFMSVYGVKMNMSIESAALTLTVFSFGNVFFQIPIGWIADRTSNRGTVITCFMVTAIGLAILPFVVTTIWVWPLLPVLGAAGFGIYTVGLAELGDRFSGADLIAGTASFSTMWGLGALIGSIICGLAMDMVGPHGFPAILLIVFISYLIAQAIRMRKIRVVRAS